jgi:hypothetical protein
MKIIGRTMVGMKNGVVAATGLFQPRAEIIEGRCRNQNVERKNKNPNQRPKNQSLNPNEINVVHISVYSNMK